MREGRIFLIRLLLLHDIVRSIDLRNVCNVSFEFILSIYGIGTHMFEIDSPTEEDEVKSSQTLRICKTKFSNLNKRKCNANYENYCWFLIFDTNFIFIRKIDTFVHKFWLLNRLLRYKKVCNSLMGGGFFLPSWKTWTCVRVTSQSHQTFGGGNKGWFGFANTLYAKNHSYVTYEHRHPFWVCIRKSK